MYNYDLNSKITYTLNIDSEVYDLTGVLEHTGRSLHIGHYNFYALAAPYGETKKAWKCSDDNPPQEISEGALATKFSFGYVTTWERRSTGTELVVAEAAATAAAAVTSSTPATTETALTTTNRFCCSLRFKQNMISTFRFGPSLADFPSPVQM